MQSESGNEMRRKKYDNPMSRRPQKSNFSLESKHININIIVVVVERYLFVIFLEAIRSKIKYRQILSNTPIYI